MNQNIGETTQRGLEVEADVKMAVGLDAQLAHSYIHAVVGQSYFTCVGTPCNPLANHAGGATPNCLPVAAGNLLPAIARNCVYLGLTWHYAPMRAGFEQDNKHWHLSEFGLLDNFAYRAYVGSVIVNETNARYFEPAPGRTAYIMFNAERRRLN